VPLGAVRSVEARRRRVGERAVLVDGVVALPARHRVDLWLELAEPVTISRPLAAPVRARRRAIAADEPALLVAALRAPRPHTARLRGRPVAGLVALPDLAYGSH
jgi:hypothetical protein